jgi:hypothetical protein
MNNVLAQTHNIKIQKTGADSVANANANATARFRFGALARARLMHGAAGVATM